MLKKLLIVQLVLMVVSFQAAVASAKLNPDTGPGCGLGKLAWMDYKAPKQIA
ncbi:MAG: orotate phosphoribosyltransferase, partial [Nitrospirae bacterium]|nr:orotate phosphoribosyltransferase [Nitrospirota bacterium]